jgi:hypothetical protein
MALEQLTEYYCTILSNKMLYQGLALYHSIRRFREDFEFHVLCTDEEVYEIMKGLQYANILAVPVSTMEDSRLLAIKKGRREHEYCWTLKPVFIEHLLKNCSGISRITYLDGDLFFLSEPSLLFQDAGNWSVLLSKHDYSTDFKYLECQCGTYNSGLISFKNDPSAQQCVSWWKEQCLQLCSCSFENSQYGDQKYLEQMPLKFEQVETFRTRGINVGPWNFARYKKLLLMVRLFKQGCPFVCYHFSRFRHIDSAKYSIDFGPYRPYEKELYRIYLPFIARAIKDVDEKGRLR